MLEDSVNLLTGDARKPLQELEHGRATFEILKEGANGNASTTKEPVAADLARKPFDRGARCPIKHAEVYIRGRQMRRKPAVRLRGRFRPRGDERLPEDLRVLSV